MTEPRSVLGKRHIRGKVPRLGRRFTCLHVDDPEVALVVFVEVRDERERFPIGAVRQARDLRRARGACRHLYRLANLLIGLGIEKPKPVCTDSTHGERLPVRADGDLSEVVAAAVHDPDRSGRAQELGQQVAASLRRVVDRDRLAGEQKRTVEILLDERLGAKPLGELGRLRVARVAALDDREHPAGERRRQQDPDTGEQPAKAPVRPSGLLRFLLRDLAALGDELALELVEVECTICGRVEGGSEAGAAVELALIASCRVPFGRCLGDVAAKPAPFGVLFDPLAQAWPFAQQRLMGDLDGVLPTR